MDANLLLKREELARFLKENYIKEIENILVSYKRNNRKNGCHYSLKIDACKLFDNWIESELFCNNPIYSLKEIHLLISSLIEQNRDVNSPEIFIRLVNLPKTQKFAVKKSLPLSEGIGKFCAVKALVMKVSQVKVYSISHRYMCLKCRKVINVRISTIEGPLRSSDPPGSCNEGNCDSTKFFLLKEVSSNKEEILFVDYQEVKIQELLGGSTTRCIPRSSWAILLHDHVDICQPGDEVTLFGVIMPRYKSFVMQERCTAELVLVVNHIVVNTNKINFKILKKETVCKRFVNFWKLYHSRSHEGLQLIIESFSPHIYGLSVVRLALLLALIGGISVSDSSNGNRTRGDSHILLVGEPGTGKSDLLKFCTEAVSRSVYTTGTGLTTAGLTASVVRDSCSEYSLQAGALPLSDGGICCIDEFSCVKEKDLMSIHEAMEQQTISIAKAGIVAQLKTRSSIIAATNPKKSLYTKGLSTTEMLNIPPPLLSRFDLILLIGDDYEDNHLNKKVSKSILKGSSERDCFDESNELWDIKTMQAYISYAKTLFPVFSKKAMVILKKYYRYVRDSNNGIIDASRKTLRLLESLIRLSTAHAKLMMHKSITVKDSLAAVILMEISFYNVTNNYQGVMSHKSREYYDKFCKHFYEMCEEVLINLDLPHLVDRVNDHDDIDTSVETESYVREDEQIALKTQFINQIPDIMNTADDSVDAFNIETPSYQLNEDNGISHRA